MKDRIRGWMHALGRMSADVRAWLERHEGMGGAMRSLAALALVLLLGAASVSARRQLTAGSPAQTQTREAAAALLPAGQAATPEPTATPEPARWQWPVAGEILGAYSPEALVWSDTMGQWQAHPALDIAAAPGEAVCACADGTVADAWQDRLWGDVIVLDHGDGWRSTYANLNTLNLVTVGASVRKSDVISAVGRTADCESGMDWHLHFALEKDGAPVDFAELAGPLQ